MVFRVERRPPAGSTSWFSLDRTANECETKGACHRFYLWPPGNLGKSPRREGPLLPIGAPMAVISNGLHANTRPERQLPLPRPVTLMVLLAVYAAIVAAASADFGRAALLIAGLGPAALLALYALLLERAARAQAAAGHERLDFDIRGRVGAYDPAAVAFAQSYVRTRPDEEIRRSQRSSLPPSV